MINVKKSLVLVLHHIYYFVILQAQPEEEASDRDESVADESLNVSEVSMEGHSNNLFIMFKSLCFKLVKQNNVNM